MERILVELIDELVYEERQRILVEEKMSIRVEELENLSNDLVLCVQQMCDYTLALERALWPVSCDVKTPKDEEVCTALSEKRSQMIKSTAGVCGAVGPDAERLLQSTSPLAARGVSPSEGSQPEGDAGLSAAADAAAVERLRKSLLANAEALLGPLVDVRNLLAKSARRSQNLLVAPATPQRAGAVPSGDPSLSAPAGREWRVLCERVESLSDLLREGRREGSLPSESRVPAVDETRVVAASNSRIAELEDRQRADAAQLRAYEKTVHALNAEVSAVQAVNAKLTQGHAKELEQLQAEHRASLQKSDAKLGECDAALCRVSLEMEQLIKENAQLKKQIRVWQGR